MGKGWGYGAVLVLVLVLVLGVVVVVEWGDGGLGETPWQPYLVVGRPWIYPCLSPWLLLQRQGQGRQPGWGSPCLHPHLP